MCLANSCLSAFNAASTFSDIALSACTCESVFGGPDAHAATPHNTATATPANGTRLITRDTLVASSFLSTSMYTTRGSGANAPIDQVRRAAVNRQPRRGGAPSEQAAGPLERPGPAIHTCLWGHQAFHAQNLKFNPVENPIGWQPPQVVLPALV